MRVVELFAGVGGFRIGLERAGHEVIYANEFDKYAAQTYNKNFGGSIDQRDIRTVPSSDIPDHDLLVGGFPCQAFSVAGKRGGFNDTRGTLFFEIARILADKKPKHILLENVKGLLSHDSGRTFQTILGVLADLGYRVEWQVLNSKDFGVPQNRERIIISGHLRTEPRPEVFPIGADYQADINIPTLTARYWGGQALGGYISHSDGNRSGEVEQINQPKHSNDRVYSQGGVAPTLNTMQGGRRQPFVSDPPMIRRLTPVECERLQGFPDNWTAGVSDSQRYKQMGNAVTVNVIEAVASRLRETLPNSDGTNLAGGDDVQ